MPTLEHKQYQSQGGLIVDLSISKLDYKDAAQVRQSLAEKINAERGVLLSSSYEYPGRYTTWDFGFVKPPIAIASTKNEFRIEALNARGQVLLAFIHHQLKLQLEIFVELTLEHDHIKGQLHPAKPCFYEAERTRQTSIFSVLRNLIQAFKSDADPHWGLYGAFGYDLNFQLEPQALKIPRLDQQRDLVLYLPDELYLIDHRRQTIQIHHYDYAWSGYSSKNLARTGTEIPYAKPPAASKSRRELDSGVYAQLVQTAQQEFKCGNLFEVVPSQSFFEPCQAKPAEVFVYLRQKNPAPFGFLMNLGAAEYLVGASPEIYVRVKGQRVETCPISGTIARGQDALSDAKQILTLLNSSKEASELTMCTDVDRNDKSRVCLPGSVKVIGRRQIEMYSRVIHTVDHVEGQLKPEYDALDAFLTHTWAVTVTGAPKIPAIQFIENHESSQRRWYAGAVGVLAFNGDMNTGLTLRTMRIKDGIAEIRAGATLLFDSIPHEEEQETELKASALIDAVRNAGITTTTNKNPIETPISFNKHIVLIDHQDSFVLTLANYLNQLSPKVTTLRVGFPFALLDELKPDLVILSPGPGKPADFKLQETIRACLLRNIPIFGVCLGLQGLVEYFGGELGILDYPMHGKACTINTAPGVLFDRLPSQLSVGRYHSLYALPEKIPPVLKVTATAEQDGVIMAVEHQTLPVWAVQFHPESILSLEGNFGFKILQNVLKMIP